MAIEKRKPRLYTAAGDDTDGDTATRPVGSLNEHPITLRLPEKLLERVEELVPYVAADLEFASMGRVSRSQVLRIAVFQGLNVLRHRYGLGTGSSEDH
jgi:hypothetical protein